MSHAKVFLPSPLLPPAPACPCLSLAVGLVGPSSMQNVKLQGHLLSRDRLLVWQSAWCYTDALACLPLPRVQPSILQSMALPCSGHQAFDTRRTCVSLPVTSPSPSCVVSPDPCAGTMLWFMFYLYTPDMANDLNPAENTAQA